MANCSAMCNHSSLLNTVPLCQQCTVTLCYKPEEACWNTKNSLVSFKKKAVTAALMLGKMLVVEIQCLYSAENEVMPGNVARKCESFPGDTKWLLCGVVWLIMSPVVCSELILDEWTNALTDKTLVLRLQKFNQRPVFPTKFAIPCNIEFSSNHLTSCHPKQR